MAKSIEQYPVNYEAEYRIASIASGVLNIDGAIEAMEQQMAQPQQRVEFQPIDFSDNTSPTDSNKSLQLATDHIIEAQPSMTDIDSVSKMAQQFARGSREMFTDTGN